MREYYVYIMTNKINTVLYTGVTNNLMRRVYEHRNGIDGRFTSKYKCRKLVYFQSTPYIIDAIEAEKRIKAGSRRKKIDLIESMNPDWRDLSEDWDW